MNCPQSPGLLCTLPGNFIPSNCLEWNTFTLPLKQKLEETLASYPVDEVLKHHSIDLSFNIDGLPLYKSSKTCMWPVLCAVMLHPVTIFPTALTCGTSQPTDLSFLEDTVRELGHLLKDGINFMGRKLKINLRCFVCDAPAHALVKKKNQTVLQVLWLWPVWAKRCVA